MSSEESGKSQSGKKKKRRVRYGEEEIESVEIRYFPNPAPNRDYYVQIRLPELTFKDPVSGYPDFAVATMVYIPDARIVDLKTLKLYFNSFRDKYFSHERITNELFDELLKGLEPKGALLMMEFNPRGNVSTRVVTTTDDAFLEQARNVLELPVTRPAF
ncbi:MAG: preQ(1) synthase [Chloroflexota bacterium]|nr:preQ(1) synthase [Chloroflexota bacterium]MDE2840426.1 preQ(1) synthase [Chloroflexota bacterium]MDE2931698.1 preQ(1) synthase [Chloroflexota bacterium]